MAFQDFGHLSERRKAERQQKLKKRIVIAAITIFVLLALIGAGIFAYTQYVSHHHNATEASTNSNNQQKTQPAAASAGGIKDVSHSIKAIKMICSYTDYKAACEESLSKAAAKSNHTQPKDLLKAAISVAANEVEKALNQSSTFKIDNPEEKAAFEDCKVLLQDAKEELGDSVSHVDTPRDSSSAGGSSKFSSGDLNNWLSAVMSYQQSCVDGIPEGKLKSQMRTALKSTKEFTSNALAIVSEVSSILSTFQIPGINRRLLTAANEYSNHTSVQDEENQLPTWITHEDRRMLGELEVKLIPNVIVAKDGSGNFTRISDALAAMPPKYEGRYIIYVKEGTYEETVTIEKKMVNVTMYGDGSQKTIVTGSKNFVDGVRTFHTATFVAIGEGFMAKAMGFRNTAGPEKHQAVAIRVQSDRSVFFNCRMEGYQDTVYAQTHRQLYRSCVIAGTVDFIFGDASAIFQNCMIVVRKPLDNQQNIVTAQGRTDKRETTGIVLQNCRILADKKLEPQRLQVKTYLGRPWKEYSRTIVMESTLGDLIQPQGWLPWEGEFALKTLYYAEYNNKGPGAAVDGRVKWPGYKGVIGRQEANQYTVGPFLQGDQWVKATGAPVHLGLYTT
ncbi:pectinesterase-like [Malania oleifera]|uniref:pectinesterase-like n=1 Tax=Malania oleifera TaxID=397392 RepID=UPI0025AE814C|nr:pectinesterase-like [Malania oleifera]